MKGVEQDAYPWMADCFAEREGILGSIHGEGFEPVRGSGQSDVATRQRIAERLKAFDAALPFVRSPPAAVAEADGGQKRSDKDLCSDLGGDTNAVFEKGQGSLSHAPVVGQDTARHRSAPTERSAPADLSVLGGIGCGETRRIRSGQSRHRQIQLL